MVAYSCNKDNDNNEEVKQLDGFVWISGGLATCAEQIHLVNGDTLIVRIEEFKTLKSGDKVNVKYKELGANNSCPFGIDCEIIELKKIN
jgi:hypothetical protein